MILLQDIQQNLWVTIVITLFILSMISERLANLIKLYFQSWYDEGTNLKRKTKSLKGASLESQRPKEMRSSKIGQVFGNLRYRQIDPNLEKQREKGVQTVAVLCGILVAIFAGADLFVLIQTSQTLDWQLWFKNHSFEDVFTIKMFSHALGAIFAGFFISLGSKFWHDVLDFVLYSSNLKRKLADPRTNDSESIDELEEFLSFSNNQLRRLAFMQNVELFNQGDILYRTHSTRIVDGKPMDCIGVFVRKNSKIKLPNKVRISLPKSGFETFVPLQVIEIDDIPKVSFGVGKISREGESFGGSSCCLLQKSNRIYLLTCCHLFTNGDFVEDLKLFEDTNNDIIATEDGEIIGNVVFADIDNLFDVALIDVTEAGELTYPVNIQKISTEQDYHIGKKVLFQSMHDNEGGFGFITSILPKEQAVPIEFNNAINKMFHLIEISTDMTGFGSSPTQFGDSGGLVYDEERSAIGMILAISSRHTYVIPLHSMTNSLKANLFTNPIV